MRCPLVVLAIVLGLAGCATEARRTVTIYLLEGGKLTPVERAIDEVDPLPRSAVAELLRGPTNEERARGLVSPLQGARLRSLAIVGDRAIVDLAGTSPTTVEAGGQLLYTLTELPGLGRVSLRFDGEPCCFWSHAGDTIETVTRRTLRYWSGEPCHLRTTATHVRCRPA